jgi:uncharacterized protein YndB with AHSA1/START domain
MSTPTDTGTVTLHRVLRAPPDRVYRAFLDPDAMAKFLPPHGFTERVLEMNATGHLPHERSTLQCQTTPLAASN